MQTRKPSYDLITVCDSSISIDYLNPVIYSLKNLDYPRELLNIFVVYACDDKPINPKIVEIVQNSLGTIIFASLSSKVYNLSESRNYGARRSSSDNILFTDADVLIHPETLIYANSALIDNCLGVIPLARHPEPPHKFNFYLEGNDQWKKASEGVNIYKGSKGNLVVRRKEFEELCGFDERFIGWGAEDADFYERCSELAGATNLLYFNCPPSIHQHHETRTWRKEKLTKKNRTLFNKKEGLRRNGSRWGGVNSTKKGYLP